MGQIRVEQKLARIDVDWGLKFMLLNLMDLKFFQSKLCSFYAIFARFDSIRLKEARTNKKIPELVHSCTCATLC